MKHQYCPLFSGCLKLRLTTSKFSELRIQIVAQDVAQGKDGVHIYAGDRWNASTIGYMKNFKFDTE